MHTNLWILERSAKRNCAWGPTSSWHALLVFLSFAPPMISCKCQIQWTITEFQFRKSSCRRLSCCSQQKRVVGIREVWSVVFKKTYRETQIPWDTETPCFDEPTHIHCDCSGFPATYLCFWECGVNDHFVERVQIERNALVLRALPLSVNEWCISVNLNTPQTKCSVASSQNTYFFRMVTKKTPRKNADLHWVGVRSGSDVANDSRGMTCVVAVCVLCV
jgi:hypothetical protein